MAGGYWGKGNNPYWNFDSDGASRDRRMHEAELDSFKSQLSNQSLHAETARLRNQLTNTLNSHKKEIDTYEKRLEGFRLNFYKIAIQRNIFKTTLDRLQEQWPEYKEDILDEIQRQRVRCNQPDYREKWWNAVSQNNIGDSILEFPFPERELKNKP